MPTIRLSDDVYKRLQEYADGRPLGKAIERLLDSFCHIPRVAVQPSDIRGEPPLDVTGPFAAATQHALDRKQDEDRAAVLARPPDTPYVRRYSSGGDDAPNRGIPARQQPGAAVGLRSPARQGRQGNP